MNDPETSPSTPTGDAAAGSSSASKPSRARRAPSKARSGSSGPESSPATAAEPSANSPTIADRFRSRGVVASHDCPNGHGATEPVEPGHTFCAQCCAHWTVRPANA